MTAATRRPRIVVIGDLLADVWWQAGPSSRNIEHAAMALVSAPGSKKITAGGVGIVAAALGRAGFQDVSLFSIIGPQPEASLALRTLTRIGVNTEHVIRDADFVTPIKTRYINANGHILLRHDIETTPAGHSDFSSALAYLIKDADFVVVSDYAKGCITPHDRLRIVQLCQRYSKLLLVDTKPSVIDAYRCANIFKLNRAETEAVAGAPTGSLLDTAYLAACKLNCDALIATDGDNGVVWASAMHKRSTAAPKKHVAGNCVGAGDIFFAGLILGLAQRDALGGPVSADDLDKAVFYGLVAAGQRVRTNGFKPFSPAAIQQEVFRHQTRFNPARKICSYREFCRLAAQLRESGRRIVFTNGCFDLMHEGHVSTLMWSRKQGDALFVAVDSDQNVRRLKGATRPVHDETTRATNVAALECVDAVCVFDETAADENMSLRDLIRAVQPAFLTKGPDYADKKIVGQEFADQVLLCPLVPGKSTTAFVNKMTGSFNS
jgi:D-beta-D-heptose 7-phosphate kinase/D-beta-D-heptose 1-phosphate adenosyltransferase